MSEILPVQPILQSHNLRSMYCLWVSDTQTHHVRTDDQHNAQLSASHATSLKGLNYHTISESKKNLDFKNGHTELLSFARKHAFPTVTGLFE